MNSDSLKKILKEKAKAKLLQFLVYSRKDRNFRIEQILVIGLSDRELEKMVKEHLRKAKKRGAIHFEGKFEDLPVNERKRLYENAKRMKMRWYEIECESCGQLIDLFEDEVFRFQYKDWEELIECRGCFGNYGDEPINDELLAKQIKKHRPRYKSMDQDLVIVSKQGWRKIDLIYQGKHPLSLKAIRQFGKRV